MFVLKFECGTFGICEINNRSEYEYSKLLERIERNSHSKFFHHFPESRLNWLLVFNLQQQTIPNLKQEYYALNR